MAGFLRKKKETNKGPPLISSPVTLTSSAAPPPLFARFATTAINDDHSAAPRIVSSPVSLAAQSRSQGKGGGGGVGGKYGNSTNSVAAGSREAEIARRRAQQEEASPYRAPTSPQPRPSYGAAAAASRPLSRVIVDKPLPPPVDEPNPPRTAANRGPRAPPQQQNGTRGRASFDSKPLPPTQSFHPPSNYNFTPSSKGSTPLPRTPQPLPPSYSQKALPRHDQSQSQSQVTQDFPPTEASSSVPVSDGGLDLPAEFALFQDYGETIPSQPNSLNSREPPAPVNGDPEKPTGQVPSSSALQSNVYDGPSQPSTSQNDFGQSQSRPSPPLPPPPPREMGTAASSLSGPSINPTPSYKDFYPAQVLNSMNGHSTTYTDFRDVNQQQQQQSQPQPQMMPHRSTSTSPPLPPGAASPTSYQSFHERSPAGVPSRISQRPLPRPSPPITQRSMPPEPLQPLRASLRKSPSVQTANTPMRGKPRIFAAMEAQEIEPEPTSNFTQQQNSMSPAQPYQNLPPPQEQPYVPDPPKQRRVRPPSALLEDFMTPKSDFEPLPNNVHNEDAIEPVPQPSSPPPTPRSPRKLPVPEQQGVIQQQQQQQQLPAPRTPRNKSRTLPAQDETLQTASPQTPSRRRLTKNHSVDSTSAHAPMNGLGSTTTTTTLPSTPEGHHRVHQHGGHRAIAKARPASPVSPMKQPVTTVEPVVQLDRESSGTPGVPLDDDPFARVEGVKMLKPATPPPPLPATTTEEVKETKSSKTSRSRTKGSKDLARETVYEDAVDSQRAEPEKASGAPPPSTSASPRRSRKDKAPLVPVPSMMPAPRVPITTVELLLEPQVLSCLLEFLSFYEWCLLLGLSKEIRTSLVRTPSLREVVLERFLKTIGYSRWAWDDKEPLSLSLQDLGDYMRCVSTPTHEYARVAAMYVHSLTIHPNHRDPSLGETVQSLTAATRAYTRVLLRLRAQAEKEASLSTGNSQTTLTNAPKSFSFSPGRAGNSSRVSSRAPSPTTSSYSHSQSPANAPGAMQPSASQASLGFRSPLFRLRRAPLLRVFVPSPEGDWLSDRSVLECEAECKRAGVTHLMRLGDVVWDVAVGDEGNVGRLVWDGSYLIDLDYTYSTIGELPKYMPTLAFPPSYFHRVIRTGANATNPIVHIDLSPWGEEIAMNLQLLQDRVRTETPQGAYHNVMRWVHRSSFSIRPPRGPQRYNHSGRGAPVNNRIPIPESDNLFVDPGWYGTIVVETEGTNEALADLQDRCGPGAFPPRPRGGGQLVTQGQAENRKVFRILREKSRPGEIWIRAVGVKERLL